MIPPTRKIRFYLALTLIAVVGVGCGDPQGIPEDSQRTTPPAQLGSMRRPLSTCAAVPNAPRPVTESSFNTWKTAVHAVLQCL